MTASDRSTGWHERAFIVALVVGALLLRVYRIGHQSLWVDELLTLDVSDPKDGLNIWSYVKYNIHGPLHSFVVYLFQLVSSKDAWLRMPSALIPYAANKHIANSVTICFLLMLPPTLKKEDLPDAACRLPSHSSLRIPYHN